MIQISRILIVEDSAMSAYLLNQYLKNHSVSADIVESAEDAQEKVLNGYYDCLLIDLGLPSMSGLELATWLRKHGYKKILITITSDTQKREQAMECGFDDYIVKPWTRHDLVNKINILILKERRERILKQKAKEKEEVANGRISG